MLKKNKILSTLIKLGIVNKKDIEIYSKSTRDVNNLSVFKDKKSNIIFIDNFYVGIEEYQKANYKKISKPGLKDKNSNYEDYENTKRRIEKYIQFISGLNICDFGCGSGDFLVKAKQYANNLCGVEPAIKNNANLNKMGIPCYENIEEVKISLDTIFLFHSFEHLNDPLASLKSIYNKLKSNGKGRIIIEVPHAKDFLLDKIELNSFKNFTLWSQHLILHTRESLYLFLKEAGFKDINIEGVQRYNIANHLYWLNKNKPGGHKSNLSIIETEELKTAYSNALSKIDANDTLVAIAST